MIRLSLYCLTLTLFATLSVHAQPDSLWSRTYGGERDDECLSLVQTADGGFALAGYTWSFGASLGDFWLMRTDEDGDSLWSHTYGGEQMELCYSLIQTADGGFALAGLTTSFGAGHADFWLLRTDENGERAWSRTFGGGGNDVCTSLAQTADGGYALAGYTNPLGAGGDDFWLVRADENGDSLWSRTYGGEHSNRCNSLIQTTDEGFALAGYAYSIGAEDFWLARTDEDGDSLWSRTYGGEGEDVCRSLVQTADGGFALAGWTGLFNEEDYDFWLVRTDENGDSLWSRTYGGQYDDYCNSLVLTADGGYALAGWTNSFGAGDDFWLVRMDENGGSLWSRTYGGEDPDECNSLIRTTDGGYALAGSTGFIRRGQTRFLAGETRPRSGFSSRI